MKIHNGLVAAAIGLYGWVKYDEFINFIDNLKVGLNVVNLDNGNATVNIKNINTAHIPYKFDKVELINENNHLATNNDANTNLSIVPFSNIPIVFKQQKEVTIQEVQNSKIAITFLLGGIIPFKRLYTPEVAETPTGKTEIDYQSKGFTKPKCGCNH